MEIKFKRLNDTAVLPKAANPGDALDLSAVDEVILHPNVPALVKTGWAIELPPNVRAWVTPRSGLALKHGVTVWNAPGLVDPQYRGEVGVILVWNGYWHLAVKDDVIDTNYVEGRYIVKPGARIAQLTFSRIEPFEISETSELSETARGNGGFGSTGR